MRILTTHLPLDLLVTASGRAARKLEGLAEGGPIALPPGYRVRLTLPPRPPELGKGWSLGFELLPLFFHELEQEGDREGADPEVKRKLENYPGLRRYLPDFRLHAGRQEDITLPWPGPYCLAWTIHRELWNAERGWSFHPDRPQRLEIKETGDRQHLRIDLPTGLLEKVEELRRGYEK